MFGRLNDAMINSVKNFWGVLNNYGVYDDVVYSAARYIPEGVFLGEENNSRREIYFGLMRLSEGDNDFSAKEFIANLKENHPDDLVAIQEVEDFTQKYFLETEDEFFISSVSGYDYKKLISKLENYFTKNSVISIELKEPSKISKDNTDNFFTFSNPPEIFSNTASYIINHPTEILINGLLFSSSFFQVNIKRITPSSGVLSSCMINTAKGALSFTILSQQFLSIEAAFPAMFDLNNLNNPSTNADDGVISQGRVGGGESGLTVSSAGDVNNDGFADMLIGTPYATPLNRTNAGKTYLLFGHNKTWAGAIDLNTLNGTNGVVFQGRASGDLSGYAVSAAGDVNNDGFADMLIGAPYATPLNRTFASIAGETYLLFGHNKPWPAAIDLNTLNGTNGVVFQGRFGGDQSGMAVSSAGDVNNDSFADMLIGAPYVIPPNGTTSAGEIYLLFGHKKPWPAAIDLNTLNGTNGVVFQGRVSDESGWAVSAASDVNNDGFADMLIGAPGFGKTFLLFGHNKTWAGAIDLNTLNDSNGVVFQGGTSAGTAVSGAGDVNNDGFADMLIGAPYADPLNRTSAGKTYLLFGHNKTWAGAIDLDALNGANGVVFQGRASDDQSGWAVSGAGDVNNDGFADMLIGAPYATPLNRAKAGEIYLLMGHNKTWPIAIDLNTLNGTNGVIFQGRVGGDQSGFAVSGAGDVNNDGFADVLIGAPNAISWNHTRVGETYLLFGSNTMLSNSTEANRRSPVTTNNKANNIPVITGAVAGGVCLLGLATAAGVGMLLWKRNKNKQGLTQKSDGFSMCSISSPDSDIRSSKTIISTSNQENTRNSVAGRKNKGHSIIKTNTGQRYALITKITYEEANELKTQMGIAVKFLEGTNKKAKFALGKGQFGKLRIARQVINDKEADFLGVKKIKGAEEIAASENEGKLQGKLNGLKHIMPLIDSVKSIGSSNEPALYQFMPLAGFGNGDALTEVMGYAKKSAQRDIEEKRQKVITHVAQSLLDGFKNMHSHQIYHLDFKPSNFVVDVKGEIYIIDFGCAVESPTEKINFDRIGDTRYFAPERFKAILTQDQFDGAATDAWAVGLTLLEIMTGDYPMDICSLDEKFQTWDEAYFNKKLANMPELRNPKPESIWAVIRGLLNPDPVRRLTIDQALEGLKSEAHAHFNTTSEQRNDFEYLKTLLDNPAFDLKARDAVSEKKDYPVAYIATRKMVELPEGYGNSQSKDSLPEGYVNSPPKDLHGGAITDQQQKDQVSHQAVRTSGMFSQGSTAPNRPYENVVPTHSENNAQFN